MNFKGTLVVKKEEKWFVATCLENDIASQGKTMDEAIFNLKEAISLYYEDETEVISQIYQKEVLSIKVKKEAMQNIQMDAIPQLSQYMMM